MTVNNRVSYAALTYTIAAGATIGVEKQSGFITCLNASSPFKIKFDDGSFSDFEAGLSYTPLNGFSRVDLFNPTGNLITVRLGFGKGSINDARVTISDGQTLKTSERVPDVLKTARFSCAFSTNTLLAAANPLRREIIVTNVQASASGRVYISGNPAAAIYQGAGLSDGQSLTLKTTAAIYCRNDNPTRQIEVIELEHST